MLVENKKIAIVGAGPGGLTLTKLLQLNGANVKVYERDISKYARVQGSPLDMHDKSGWLALKKAEVTEAFERHVLQGADKKVITNQRAEIVYSDHESQPEDFKTSRPEISRGELRNLFFESLAPDTVIWDSHFISLEAQNEGFCILKTALRLTPTWSSVQTALTRNYAPI